MANRRVHFLRMLFWSLVNGCTYAFPILNRCAHRWPHSISAQLFIFVKFYQTNEATHHTDFKIFIHRRSRLSSSGRNFNLSEAMKFSKPGFSTFAEPNLTWVEHSTDEIWAIVVPESNHSADFSQSAMKSWRLRLHMLSVLVCVWYPTFTLSVQKW